MLDPSQQHPGKTRMYQGLVGGSQTKPKVCWGGLIPLMVLELCLTIEEFLRFFQLHSGNLTWQWKMDPLKMCFLLNMVVFHFSMSVYQMVVPKYVLFHGEMIQLDYSNIFHTSDGSMVQPPTIDHYNTIWVFPKIVVPPNHPFLIGFSIINHPFWGKPPLFLETPI